MHPEPPPVRRSMVAPVLSSRPRSYLEPAAGAWWSSSVWPPSGRSPPAAVLAPTRAVRPSPKSSHGLCTRCHPPPSAPLLPSRRCSLPAALRARLVVQVSSVSLVRMELLRRGAGVTSGCPPAARSSVAGCTPGSSPVRRSNRVALPSRPRFQSTHGTGTVCAGC